MMMVIMMVKMMISDEQKHQLVQIIWSMIIIVSNVERRMNNITFNS